MKGQISLDLMVAVLATVILLGSFFIMAESIKEDYKEMFVENQLKKISSELSTTITTSNAMDDFTYTSKIKVPVIYYENRKYSPNIIIKDNNLEASVVLSGKTIKYLSSFSISNTTTVVFDSENREVVINNG